MQSSIDNRSAQQPAPVPPHKAQQIANAIFALIMACMFVVGFFGFAVYYIVNAVEDRAALTLIFCFVGLAVFAAVCAVAAFGLYYVRGLGSALVEHQSRDNQAMQTAFVQLVAETRKTNDINLQLLNAAMGNKQLPAPKVSDGSGAFPIYNKGVQVTHDQQPAQSANWLYRLPDGRTARGDLIESIVHHGWDDYDSMQYPDYRDYVRTASNIGFGNDSYRNALAALKREGVCDDTGRFSVRQDEAWRLIEMARARAR